MASKITVEIAGLIGEAQIGEMIRAVTAAYATQVQAKLAEDKPPPPGRGKMVWKSDKQRRYVMGAWKRGEIKIPYVRGSAASGSGSGGLNKSYVHRQLGGRRHRSQFHKTQVRRLAA